MTNILEKMNRNKLSSLFYRFLGLLILIDLFRNKEDTVGEITGWLGIAALVLLSGRSLYIIAVYKGKINRITKKEDQSVLVFTILWLALYMIMKNPFALPLPWVVYGTLLFLVSGIATAAFLLLRKSD